MTLPPSVLGLYQTRLDQQSQMTAHGRPGDGPASSQIDHPHGASGDRDEQIPANRVGECGEGVHRRMVTVC